MDFVELTKVLGPSLSMVAIVLVTFVATLKIYLQYKQKLAEKEPGAQTENQQCDRRVELRKANRLQDPNQTVSNGWQGAARPTANPGQILPDPTEGSWQAKAGCTVSA